MTKYIRAFIAGIALPAAILPIVLTLTVLFEHREILDSLFIHYIPPIWGAWNVAYFAGVREMLPGPELVRYLLTGAILGLVLAVIGVFFIDLPGMLAITSMLRLAPLIGVPIFYALVWAFVVWTLNKLVGIDKA